MTEQNRVFVKCAWRLVPLMMLLYFFNITDRVNVGFAALTINHASGISTRRCMASAPAPSFWVMPFPGARQRHSGTGRRAALDFPDPSSVGGAICRACRLSGAHSFYIVRFLLGLAEAGLFPGMILYMTYWFPQTRPRARIVASSWRRCRPPISWALPISSLILQLNGTGGWPLAMAVPDRRRARGPPGFRGAEIPAGDGQGAVAERGGKENYRPGLPGEDTSNIAIFWPH